MKRICHLTSVHPYNDTRIFYKECRSLAEAGYEVYLVAPVKEDFMEKGIHVVAAGTWKNRYKRIFVTVPKVFKRAMEIKARIYHLHDPELLMIAPLLRLSGAKVVYDVHEDYITSVRQKQYIPKPLRRITAFLVDRAEKTLSLGCRRIIAEKYYKERFADATEVLNYPILPAESKMRTELPQSLNLSRRYRWFLYTGNVTQDRGALVHLDLLAADPDTAIAYIGRCSPDLADTIRETARARGLGLERIKIVGEGRYVPREEIDWYTRNEAWIAGLALFPKTEHYRKKELTKFFEYMEAGLPLLASDFPAWKALIEGDGCGICVDPENPKAVSDAVKFLINNPDRRRQMGQHGYENARSKYNWQSEARKLFDLYERLLND